MFTWVCSDCGGSVDVAHDTCPHCARPAAAEDEFEEQAGNGGTDDSSAIALVLSGEERDEPPEPTESQPSSAAAPEPIHEIPEPAPLDPLDADAAQAVPATRKPTALYVSPRHLLAFAAVLVLAVVAAVWLAGGGGLPGLRLEDPPEAVESLVEPFAIGVIGAVEVSAIRPYYDDQYQTHVKAFVANHSKQPQSVALGILLRVRQADSQGPPIASFDVVLAEPLPPNGGAEVDVPLAAMGSLQALPPWNELRVDVEPL